MHIAVLLLSMLIVLSVQLLLCAKTKKMWIAPAVLFGVLIALWVVMSLNTKDWESFGYVLLASYFACLLLSCTIGFLIYKLIKK